MNDIRPTAAGYVGLLAFSRRRRRRRVFVSLHRAEVANPTPKMTAAKTASGQRDRPSISVIAIPNGTPLEA
jgi:hypothetical protein